MKFIVMLAVLLLRGVPGRSLTRPLDQAFQAWQGGWAKRTQRGMGSSLVFLLSVLPWVVLLWVVLWWVDGLFWSLPTLALHLLVVFYALGRRSELVWLERYMIAWRQGDHQAASYYAEDLLERSVDAANDEDLHSQVVARILYLAFERSFLVLFWYLLLGPLGALMARLSELAISYARQQGEVDEQVHHFHQVLEWPAVRLMGLTLGLVSRPWAGLLAFFRDLPQWRLSAEAFLYRQFLVAAGSAEVADEQRSLRPELMSEEADQEMLWIREWVWRSLAVWVAATALGVIFWG